MIKFGQKEYSEYEAMRVLWMKIQEKHIRDIELIDRSALIPILKGENVVLEKFVISSRIFGKDKYRAYFKMGARIKMPDKIRFPVNSYYKDTRYIGQSRIEIKGVHSWPGDFVTGKIPDDKIQSYLASDTSDSEFIKVFSELEFKQNEFTNKDKKKNNNNNNNGGAPKGPISASFSPNMDMKYDVDHLIAEVVKYDKTSRSLIIEADTIENIITAFNILPFGINYKKYILDA